MRAFLDGVEAGRPEQQGDVRIDGQAGFGLKGFFIDRLVFGVGFGVIGGFERLVRAGVIIRVGGVQDAFGAAGVVFVGDFALDLRGDEGGVLPFDDFPQESRADGIDEVGSEDAAGEQVDEVVRA